ncbi:hypothetical protein HK102_007509, partial [Quaeritorhiza haematococci]
DYSYWTRTKPMQHITVHIALDDQTLENGCIMYIPQSHTWPLLPVTSRHFDDMDSIQSVLTPEQKAQFKPTPVLLKKGEAVFHHSLTVHGSRPNRSQGMKRRAAVINYFGDGTVAAAVETSGNEEADEKKDEDEKGGIVVLENTPKLRDGEKLEGQFFPLLPSAPTEYVTGTAGSTPTI